MRSSLIFKNEATVNQLIAICTPLLLIANELPRQISFPNIKKLYQTCCDAIKISENRAKQLGYPSSVILAMRFYLCALIDELILNTSWGRNSEWKKRNLVNTFQRETHPGEQFFDMLAHEKKEPLTYIDVVELAYLCLRLGFQGKYRQYEDDAELKKISEETFEYIRKIRGEFSKKILLSEQPQRLKRKKYLSFPPIWLSGMITLLVLFGIYFSYHRQLNNMSRPIQQTLSEMSQSNAQ